MFTGTPFIKVRAAKAKEHSASMTSVFIVGHCNKAGSDDWRLHLFKCQAEIFPFPKGQLWLILLPINNRYGEASQMKRTCWNIVASLYYDQKQPTFWHLCLIYSFSVFRNYVFCIPKEHSCTGSWLLNVIYDSEVHSNLFYCDFKLYKSLWCHRTGFVILKENWLASKFGTASQPAV